MNEIFFISTSLSALCEPSFLNLTHWKGPKPHDRIRDLRIHSSEVEIGSGAPSALSSGKLGNESVVSDYRREGGDLPGESLAK